jgi:DNA-binding beta-propeller fold protein YncE
MRNLLDRRRSGWAGILCLTLCEVLLVIGPGAEASTGASELWVSRYNGPGDGLDQPYSVAASPDGSKVYVTGWSRGITSGNDYATVAYDATGTQLWVSRYNGPGNAEDSADSMAVSPDGSKVFVTGLSRGTTSDVDYATVAYDATGTQLWVSRYTGPGRRHDEAHSVTVSPDGSKVFVTGVSIGSSRFNEYATVAYDAALGAQLWDTRYVGNGIGAVARSMTVSPDGSKVFVTGVFTIVHKRVAGSCHVTTGNYDWATVAYEATTGAQLWVSQYDGPAHGDDEPHAVAVSADGSKVFVAGRAAGTTTCWDYITVAYDSAAGAQLWQSQYNGPANADDAAHAMAVSPDGSKVFVTGDSIGTAGNYDYATLAYDAASGAQVWVMRYAAPAFGKNDASAAAVSPDGSTVFVSGGSWGGTTGYDYATVAYAA